MDLQNAVRKAEQVIRVPLGVIRNRPEVVRHVLVMMFDLALKAGESYTFSYGWAEPRAGAIVILAQPSGGGPPVLLECSMIRAYRTLVTAYEIKPDEALLPKPQA